MKDFKYYSSTDASYYDYPSIVGELKDAINNERLTAQERLEKLKELPKLASKSHRELNEPFHKEQHDKLAEFWKDCRDDLGYAKNLSQEAAGALERKAWEDGHAYGFGEVYAELTSLVEMLEEMGVLK